MIKIITLFLALVSLSCQTNQAIDPAIFNTGRISTTIVEWENYPIPQLNRYRDIHIYLPPDYHLTKDRYPVAYLMDGQHVFKGWQVDSSVETLIKNNIMDGIILVAIDNSPFRVQEYVPYTFESQWINSTTSDADALGDFIVGELKKEIDKSFRTLQDRKNTLIGGSSFGSFFSLYTAARYPEVFGGVAAFSTALASDSTAKALWRFLEETRFPMDTRWFLYVGQNESTYHSQHTYEILHTKGLPSTYVLDPRGGHNQPSWAAGIRPAIPWLLGYQVDPEPIWTGVIEENTLSVNTLPETSGGTYSAGKIRFEYKGPAEKVYLAGSFNKWDLGNKEYFMKEVEEDLFCIDIDLDPGEYHYKYVINGKWESPDEILDLMRPSPTDLIINGFGSVDAVLEVIK